MKEKKLQLNVFMGSGNRANVVFKCEGQRFKIERMSNALQFVATMEQLRMSVIAGGGRENWFVLRNAMGWEWLLECRHVNGKVSIELWAEGIADGVKSDFSWYGSVGEFDRAVKKLSAFEKTQ